MKGGAPYAPPVPAVDRRSGRGCGDVSGTRNRLDRSSGLSVRLRSCEVVYSPRYAIDIGLHVFPTAKYGATRDRLIRAGVIEAADLVEPQPATWDDARAGAHTRTTSRSCATARLSAEDLAQLELPWSAEMVDGFRVMVGGTIEAAADRLRPRHDAGELDDVRRSAMCLSHLGGGLHHAFPNHGEGFCPFNDVAVAVRVLQARGVERAAIVDLDVHHGNGTAFIFESDSRVFTFSMHQQHNYPMWKPRGSLDIGLPDGVARRGVSGRARASRCRR